MRKKVAKAVLVLAASLPMTFLAAQAQWDNNSNDLDIASYSQELDYRIEQGRSSLSSANYNNLRSLWSKIDQIRLMYTNKKMGDQERANMMASLTNLDRELTQNLHDDQNSRYQNWNPQTRSWRSNWWTNISQNYNYNDEIDTYQQSIKQRLDRGRSSGKITPSEWSHLSSSYDEIERLQRDYRRAGYSYSERNILMGKLTQLDRDLTANLHDNDYSRYHFWDPNKSSWSQNWWKPGWVAGGGGGIFGGGSHSNDAATTSFDAEIDAYQRDLKQRIEQGRQSGRLSWSEQKQLSDWYDSIDQKQREYRRGGFDPMERNSLMQMMTQLDKDITTNLHDDDRSRYKYWNSGTNNWNNKWWQNSNNTTTVNSNNYDNMNAARNMAFNEEVESYQRKLQQEINRGMRSGELTTAEANELNRQINAFDDLQKQSRNRGFTRTERDNLMNQLRTIDTSISTNMKNNVRRDTASNPRDWRDERRDVRQEDRRDENNRADIRNENNRNDNNRFDNNRNDNNQNGNNRYDNNRNDGNRNNTTPGTVNNTVPGTSTTPGTTPPATDNDNNGRGRDRERDRDDRRGGRRNRD